MKNTPRQRRNAWQGRLFLAPLMLGCMVFYAVPLMMVLWYSLTTGIGTSRKFVWLAQYEKILNNSIFRLAFGNTMKFLAVALPLILLVSFGHRPGLQTSVHPMLVRPNGQRTMK